MILKARWILPIDRPPLSPGWLEVQDGTIARVEHGRAPAGARDLGDVALLPGLVNAHTHLELSWLAGAIPQAASLVEWIRALLAARAAAPASGQDRRLEAVRRAVDTLKATGTVLVGDVSNTLTTGDILRDAGIGGVIFHELIGFSVPDPAAFVREAWGRVDRTTGVSPGGSPASRGARNGKRARPQEAAVRVVSLAAHAPYSVSPALFREIARARRDGPLSVHLAESADELEFLRTGHGPFRQLLEDLGAWNAGWTVPGCDPVEYLDRVGYLQRGVLAVHAVHLTETGLERLRAADAVIVTCPRSNVWVGGGLPRVSRFYGAGVRVAVGTDSLASAPSLNLFDELAQLRRVAPDVAAASLLDSATRVGAEALGFGATHGTLAPGRRAALVSVDVPPGEKDVEEYLVSGIAPSAIRPVV